MTQEELRKDIAQREERLARLTKAGTLTPEAQKQYAEKIANLKAQLTDEKKETPKKEPKVVAEEKPKVKEPKAKPTPKAKPIAKKVSKPKPKKVLLVEEEDEPIPAKVPRKRGRKKKVVATTTPKPKKQYVPRIAPAEGEPDCDTLLLQFRERRTKAQKNARKRKTTPVFRKIATDVVDAVEKAIKNVPKKTLKESPKQTIRKFGTLQRAAESFLKAFKGILGEDYQEKSANVELKELERLIKALIKKYGA